MPVKILVADDSVTMRRILELTFAGEDATVTGVDSGDAAVARASEIKPDVVFADVSMGTDGYKVAASIKSTPGLEQTAVILLASQKHPYDEGKARGAGVDDHVLKPFDTQLVIDKVKQVLGRPRAVAAAGAARPGAPAAPPPRPPAAPAAPVMQQPPMNEPRASRTGTIAFGKPAPGSSPGAVTAPVQPQQPAPRPAPAAAPAAAPAIAAAAARAMPADLSSKLDGLGLTSDQVAGVLQLTRDVVERVVWEVVPDLAETLIKEEIRRLTQ